MVLATNILRDVIYFLKTDISTNITDPIASSRPGNQKFVMTSYPTDPVQYPLITIKDTNSYSTERLGMQSEGFAHYLEMEIRIWARNVKERDTLADSVYDRLRTNQLDATGSFRANGLHDMKINSMVNVDEADGPKSKVITIKIMFIADS